MPALIALDGKRFGMLQVIERDGDKTPVRYICRCNRCGRTVSIRADKLRSGTKENCGCKRKKRSDCRYNARNSKLYHVYTAMKQRCFNPNCEAYKNYGGRGITVCGEWLGQNGFDNFQKWALKNGYLSGKESGQFTLDRENVNGNYEPKNCRWISIQEQQNNTTRNIVIECKGESHNLKEWSEIRGIAYSKIKKRYHSGWSPEEILEYKESGQI